MHAGIEAGVQMHFIEAHQRERHVEARRSPVPQAVHQRRGTGLHALDGRARRKPKIRNHADFEGPALARVLARIGVESRQLRPRCEPGRKRARLERRAAIREIFDHGGDGHHVIVGDS